MNNLLIECCANSVQSAINGVQGGANRIELCCSLPSGGLTPKYEEIIKAKENLTKSTPLGLTVTPDQVADGIYNFIDVSKVVTGETMLMDGGHHLII